MLGELSHRYRVGNTRGCTEGVASPKEWVCVPVPHTRHSPSLTKMVLTQSKVLLYRDALMPCSEAGGRGRHAPSHAGFNGLLAHTNTVPEGTARPTSLPPPTSTKWEAVHPLGPRLHVHVRVHVCVRARERERERGRGRTRGGEEG